MPSYYFTILLYQNLIKAERQRDSLAKQLEEEVREWTYVYRENLCTYYNLQRQKKSHPSKTSSKGQVRPFCTVVTIGLSLLQDDSPASKLDQMQNAKINQLVSGRLHIHMSTHIQAHNTHTHTNRSMIIDRCKILRLRKHS